MQHLVYLLAWLAVQWTQMWVNAKQKQDKNMTNALTDKRSENRKRVVIVVEDSPKAISNIRSSQTKCEPRLRRQQQMSIQLLEWLLYVSSSNAIEDAYS